MIDNTHLDHDILKSNHLIELAKKYLEILELRIPYKCFFINDNYEIEQGYGYIDSNQMYNYHKNLDTSENTLFVKGKIGNGTIPNSKWWSLSLEEARKKQSQLISLKVVILNTKIEKVKKSKNVIKMLEK